MSPWIILAQAGTRTNGTAREITVACIRTDLQLILVTSPRNFHDLWIRSDWDSEENMIETLSLHRLDS
jgi:hypothetical protein